MSLYATALMAIICLLIHQAHLQQVPTLIYVQEVFRHGHRYPIYPFKADGSDYVKQLRTPGQLTKLGKSMHYVLGQSLYKEYWNKLFSDPKINKTYNQSKFYVKSTNVNRTIESVQSQLLGLFENLDPLTLNDRDVNYSLPLWPKVARVAGEVYTSSPRYNSVPIHVEKGYPSPWQNGDFLRLYAPQFCPKQTKWSQQNMQRPQIQAIVKDQSIQKAIKELNTVLGINIGFFQVFRYYDNAVCMLYEGRTVKPIWTEDTPVKRALDVIYKMDMYIKYFYNEDQLATTSTGYFNETSFNFKKVIADQQGVQMALYSAHDTTVGNYLARLNLTNPKCVYQNYLLNKTKNIDSQTCIIEYPYYTANLIFELYKYDNQTVTIKIRYNGLHRQIPFCDWQEECSVDKYYQWFDSWKNMDYVQSCGIVNEEKQQSQTYFGIMVVEFGFILCFLISILYKYLQKQDKVNDLKVEMKEQSPKHAKGSLLAGQSPNSSLQKESLLQDE